MPNETIVVTGAAGGVGLELCSMLAPRYQVIGTVLDGRERERLIERVPSAAVIVADLAQPEALKQSLSSALGDVSVLRAVVSCAGVWPGAPLELIDLDDLRRTLEINTIAPLALYQSCIGALRQSRGRLVLVSSTSGKLALPFNGAYGMSKFALEAMGDVCRRESARWGVATILVEPGPIKTPMVTAMMKLLDHSRNQLSVEHRAIYGPLLDDFSAMVQTGYQTASAAADVARAIVDAVEVPDPPTRIPVGPVAQFICNLHRTHDDRAIDEIAINSVTGTRGAT